MYNRRIIIIINNNNKYYISRMSFGKNVDILGHLLQWEDIPLL